MGPGSLRQKVHYNQNFALIPWDKATYIFDYQQIMMLCDTTTTRYLAMLACESYHNAGLTHAPSPDVLMDIYVWGDQVLRDLGNAAYTVIKWFEPWCMGSFLARWETLDLCKHFQEQIVADNPDARTRQALEDLKSVLDRVQSPNQLGELFRCFRHFGHPTVDETAAAKAEKMKTREPKEVDARVLQEVEGALIRTIVVQWITLHANWPTGQLANWNMMARSHLLTGRALSLKD